MIKFSVIIVLCIMLCMAGIVVPEAAAASRLSVADQTALASCLQQEYLMRDTYQSIFTAYPTLSAFNAVAQNEGTTIDALRNLFAKYKIAAPADAKMSAAQTLAKTATSISGADAVAISLEQSTATLMTQLSRTTRDQSVAAIEMTIRTASLGSHTTAFTAEQASVAAPSSAPAPIAQRIVSFTPVQTAATFLSLLKDETVDVIELNGTYHLPYTIINIDRTRPVTVRPAAGATVVFSGANIGTDPQFWFGLGAVSGNITMQGFTFDGFVLGQQGIIQAQNVHDVALNNMTVRNSTANTSRSVPYDSWALYLSSDSTTHAVNFTANNWTVDGSNKGMSGFQIYGGNHITARGWTVSNAYYAVYASNVRGAALTDFTLDGWTVTNSGAASWGYSYVSVSVENSSGVYSNMHGTSSGILLNVGSPKLTDGGGNSL